MIPGSATLLLFILTGKGSAGREPPASDTIATFTVKREFGLKTRMTDGTVLIADVYRPITAKRVPALLVRTPYTPTGLGSYREGQHWASHGYAYVVQDVRGRGD